MRILLIEDDSAYARQVENHLRSAEILVYTTDLGEEGIDLGKRYDYDIIILDLQLPDMNGIEVLKSLRAAGVKTPVLVLSGNGLIESKVRALHYGADDYLTKPYHKDELLARLKAVIRRCNGHAHSIVTTGKLIVDLTARRAHVGKELLPLTAKEYAVLEHLALYKNRIVSQVSLMENIYKESDEPINNNLVVFIGKTRKKIATTTGGEHYIQTARGQGYVLRDPV